MQVGPQPERVAPVPGDEVDEWRLTAELADSRADLSAMVGAVRCDLKHRLAECRGVGAFGESLRPWQAHDAIEGSRIDLMEIDGDVAVIVTSPLFDGGETLLGQCAALESFFMPGIIPASAPSLDRGYLLLSQLHLAIQFNKDELSQALYQVLESWYAKAPAEEQRAIYDDFSRVYDELRLSMGAKQP